MEKKILDICSAFDMVELKGCLKMNPLIEFKEKTGKSWSRLAKEAGVNVSTLHRHAFGKRGISLEFALIYNSRWRIPFKRMAIIGENGES